VLTRTSDANESLGHNGFIRGWAIILESTPPKRFHSGHLLSSCQSITRRR
jgi:hypothetical protein